MASASPDGRPPWLAYAQLLRLPNVFTALADIALGVLVTGAWRANPAGSALLAAASACIYCAGMVWNDWFDLEVDRRERPGRPLPSGRVKAATAFALGLVLVGSGIAAAAATRLTGVGTAPLGMAGVLAAAVLAYDGLLKQTPLGPVGMGLCRFLNVLLGLSLVSAEVCPWPLRIHLAGVVGLYIVGVTWFARREAEESGAGSLTAAAAVMAAALGLAVAVPGHESAGHGSMSFPYLLVAFAFVLGRPVMRAIRRPTPRNVQAAVKTAVLGLVALDAILAVGLVGWPGLLILGLLPPALWLGRVVYST